MSWVRVGDEFTSDRRWDGVPSDARWFYLCLVSDCSKSERYDCRIPTMLALRVSDIADPSGALDALVIAGFLVINGDEVFISQGEERHMLPVAERERRRLQRQRDDTAASRLRKCQRGEHDRHCPSTCPLRRGSDRGSADGSGLTPGQDRTGQNSPAEPTRDGGQDEEAAALYDEDQSERCLACGYPLDSEGHARNNCEAMVADDAAWLQYDLPGEAG